MSITKRRKEETLSRKSVVEVDAEKVLDELFPQSMPSLPQLPQRRIRKDITMGDGSYTTFDYLVTVDPRTHEQIVDMNISTNKSECKQCGRLASYLRPCSICGKEICGFCITGMYHECPTCYSKS
jgi:hypothetical protein